jgi:hypothetical protein
MDAGQFTLREHTMRAVADDFWLYLGLDLAMGPYIDQPESRWAEMFLPEKLHDGLARVVFSGVHGTAELVKERKVLNRAHGRDKLRRKPPERTFKFLQAGVSIGALFAFLGWEAYRRRVFWARAALASLLAVSGLVTGVLGCLFLGLWAFTNHQVTYRNENILQCMPTALALTVCAWGVFKNRVRWIRAAMLASQIGLACSAIGLIGKVLPFMPQHNERIIALWLPAWCGIVIALYLSHLRSLQPLLQRVHGLEPQDDTANEVMDTEQEAPKEDPARPSTRPQPEKEEDESAPVGPRSQPAPA